MQTPTKNFCTFAAVLLAATAVSSSHLALPSDTESGLASIAESQSDVSYRLPNDTYPEHYDIELTTNVDMGETAFQGEVIIDIAVVSDTNRIVLHARQLEIIKATIKNRSANDESEELLKEYDSEREFLILRRQANEEQFTAGNRYKLTIQYSGELRDDNAGFYMTQYSAEDGNDRYLAATHFESIDARHAFPCYDEPAKLANFSITINHSSAYKALSNMPVNEQISRGDKTVFLTTPRISTYMVALVVSDFEFTEVVWGGIKSRIYSRASALGDHDLALSPGVLIFKELSEYFGIEHTPKKMDYVAVPTINVVGAENYGLVSIAESRILVNAITSHITHQTNAVLIVAHEIVHQWFGGCVAMQWWSFLWMKEGFASLFSYKAMDKTLSEWDIWQLFHTFEYQNALKEDAQYDAKPMTFYVETPTDIAGIYGSEGSVNYAKAASVLHMWNNALTEKVFQKAIHNFLINNKFKPATEEDLFLSFETAVAESDHKLPASIKEMLTSWTHQGGYPVLTVKRNYTDGSFTIKQEAFYNDETIADDKTWYVPINYAVATNPDYRNTEASHYLLNEKEITVKAAIAENDWLLLNKQSSGYYRINYDAKNWQLITQSLIKRPTIFHYRNRAQLLDDAYRFSISNLLDHGTVLGLLSYLKEEYQYAPWSTANSILSIYSHYLKGHKNYNDLKFFIAQQVTPIFRKLGANEFPGEHHYDKETRIIIQNLACQAGVKECLQETNNKLGDLINHEIPIEKNLEDYVYCNGLRQSNDKIFDSLYQKLMDSEDANLRNVLKNSLGCSQNEKQIKKFIYTSLNASSKLTLEDRLGLLYSTYIESEKGLMASIEFLNENWMAYGNLTTDTGSDNPLDSDMTFMASLIVSKTQEEKYLALLAKAKTHERVSPTLEEDVLQTIAENFKWIKQHGEPIMAWLSKYRADFETGTLEEGFLRAIAKDYKWIKQNAKTVKDWCTYIDYFLKLAQVM